MENHLPKVLPKYRTYFSLSNKIYRLIWGIARFFLFRPFGSVYLNSWRVFILRLFGAKIGKHSIVYASVNVWMPRNLVIGERTCIGPHTFIYNPSRITIGDKVTISQNCYLCGGSHDISTLSLDFITAPIIIKDYSWVCTNCFVMMGTTIEEGCVLGATSSLFKSTEPWAVYGGVPAGFIKKREIKNERDV